MSSLEVFVVELRSHNFILFSMVKKAKAKARAKQHRNPFKGPTPARKGTRYARPLQQGVAKIPNGGIQNRRATPARLASYMDALHDSHLALPRAIGGYSVVRTTDSIQSSSRVCLFGTFKWGQYWSNINGVGSVDSTLAMNATGNSFLFHAPGITQATLGGASTLVPAAITVQIMNPEALQTTNGMVVGGVMNQVPRLNNEQRTWNAFASDFTSYNKPRLMSAGKLALRGVQASGVPMNMSDLSEFTEIKALSTAVSTWDFFDAAGFAPIVLSNPNGIMLQYLITVEWRLRFDISHPAASTHVTRPPATDSTWGSVIKQMQSIGHGVKDIADVVADLGDRKSVV